MSLSIESNERLYDTLAAAIDEVGPAQESLFLVKLVLLLANQLGDEPGVEAAMEAAQQELRPR